MCDLAHVIVDEHTMLEDAVERLYKLNKDIFWLLLQHVPEGELTEQLKELRSIEKMMNLAD